MPLSSASGNTGADIIVEANAQQVNTLSQTEFSGKKNDLNVNTSAQNTVGSGTQLMKLDTGYAEITLKCRIHAGET